MAPRLTSLLLSLSSLTLTAPACSSVDVPSPGAADDDDPIVSHDEDAGPADGLFGPILVVDGPDDERLTTLALTADGGHVSAGERVRPAGERDGLVVRGEGDGTARWSRAIGGAGDAAVTSVAFLPDGDVVLGGWYTGELDLGDGTTTDAGTTRTGFLACLAAADGTPRWIRSLAAGPTAGVASLTVADDGAVLVCGDGPAPVAWFDDAGALLATADVAPLASCAAVAPSTTGWVVGGVTTHDATLAFARMYPDHTSYGGVEGEWAGTAVHVDDLVATPDGGAVYAVSVPDASGGADLYLIQVDADGITTGIGGGGHGERAHRNRDLAMLSDGDLLVATARPARIERRAADLSVRAQRELADAALEELAIAVAGDRVVVAGVGEGAQPLPGWPIGFDRTGSFVTSLPVPTAP